MSISDMIVVMKAGVVQQMGKPQEVYDDPANLFVADFVGNPSINFVEAKGAQGADGALHLVNGSARYIPHQGGRI